MAASACGPSQTELERWQPVAAYVRSRLGAEDTIVTDSVDTAGKLFRYLGGDQAQPGPDLPEQAPDEALLTRHGGITLLVLPRRPSANPGAILAENIGPSARFWLVIDRRRSNSPAADWLLASGLAVDRVEFDGPILAARLIYPVPLNQRPLIDPSDFPRSPPALSGTLIIMPSSPLTADPRGATKLALDHLLENLDPDLKIPYFWLRRGASGWERSHAGWDWVDTSSRTLEALLFARRVTGSDKGLDAESELREELLGSVKSDGLAYRRDSDFSDLEADVFDQSSYLQFLATWLELEDVRLCRALIGANVRGLLLLARPTEHGLRFEHPTYLPDGSKGLGRDNWDRADPCHHGGRLILPLARIMERIDDPLIRQLASGLVGYIVQDSGAFPEDRPPAGHLHSRTSTLHGILRYARAAGDEDLMRWARKRVDLIMGIGTEWGWFPEYIFDGPTDDPRAGRSETDVLADMIEIALFLAETDPSWYETAERFARNQLLASQWPADADSRIAGAFCGFCGVNGRGDEQQSCCSPAGAKAMALIAERTVTRGEDAIYVNLLLNGGNQDLVVLSEIPYEGRVTVESRRSGRVMVRIPPWAEHVRLDNEPVKESAWRDRYLDLGHMEAGRRRTISFDMPERSQAVSVAGRDVAVIWRGNAVIAMLSRAEPETADEMYPERTPSEGLEAPTGIFNFFVAE